MRLLLISAFLVMLLTSACFAAGISVGLVQNTGGDIVGDLGSAPMTYKDPGGMGITGSYYQAISDNVEVGGGLTFYFARDIHDVVINGIEISSTDSSYYTVIPVFTRARYLINPGTPGAVFYVGGDLRETLINVSGDFWDGIVAEGGLGFGAFAGVTAAGMFEVEAGYIYQNGAFDWEIADDIQYVAESSFYLKGSFVIDTLLI